MSENFLKKYKEAAADSNLNRRIRKLLDLHKDFMDKELDTVLLTTTGQVATLPGTNSATDIEERQMAFNTIDMIGFINLGGYIAQWDLTATTNFTITSIVPSTVDEQSTDNSLTINGTGFDQTMTATITKQGGSPYVSEASNITLTYVSSTELTLEFDLTGDTSQLEELIVTLTKGLYSSTSTIYVQPDLEVISDHNAVTIGADVDITLTMNKEITVLTSVTSDNANVVVSSSDIATGDSTGIDVNLDTSGGSDSETAILTVTADGETAEITITLTV